MSGCLVDRVAVETLTNVRRHTSADTRAPTHERRHTSAGAAVATTLARTAGGVVLTVTTRSIDEYRTDIAWMWGAA